MSKYSELAGRLDALGVEVERFIYDDDTTCDDAAAALRELEAERDRLREALRGVGKESVYFDSDGNYRPSPRIMLNVCNIARAALEVK